MHPEAGKVYAYGLRCGSTGVACKSAKVFGYGSCENNRKPGQLGYIEARGYEGEK